MAYSPSLSDGFSSAAIGVATTPNSRPLSPRRPVSPRITGLVNLENFESVKPGGALLNSPRSLGLCATYGIKPEELMPKPFHLFKLSAGAVSDAIARHRYDHFEAKRQQKLALLRAERLELIEQKNGSLGTPVSTPLRRSMTPTPSSTCNGAASEASSRRREEQQRRLSEIEAQRAARAKQRMEELELRTALASTQKFVHDEEITAAKAREHLRRVAETSRNAKTVMAQSQSARRESALRSDLERAIKSLDAQAALLRQTHTMSLRHSEAMIQARKRSNHHTSASKQRALQKVEKKMEQSVLCHERLDKALTHRVAMAKQHDALVANDRERAAMLAEEERSRRRCKLEDKEEHTESHLNEQERQRALSQERSSSARRSREASAWVSAEALATMKHDYLLSKLTLLEQKFNNKQCLSYEQSLWDAERLRQAAEDRAEEVNRVRRAKDFERTQARIAHQIAHGCTDGSTSPGVFTMY